MKGKVCVQRCRASRTASGWHSATRSGAREKHIAGLNLSPADKADPELDLIREDYEHPEESFGDWLVRNPNIEAVPDSLWSMMDIRYTVHPEEMIHWMDSLSPSPLRDAFCA